jgi:hypothetical protein
MPKLKITHNPYKYCAMVILSCFALALFLFLLLEKIKNEIKNFEYPADPCSF